MKALLVLEDGTWYPGESFGKIGESFGEVVFNTCMTGYQEITTDPSYKGQMVTMTYPLIGNYGMNDEDMESFKTHIEGLIVKELCRYPNNWRSHIGPEEYFQRQGIQGIMNIDTRALTLHIRKAGSMFGVISTEDGNIERLVRRIQVYRSHKRNLVMEVTSKKVQHIPGSGKKVIVVDLGVKQNIIRCFMEKNCDIFIVPADTSPLEILKLNPDRIVLSNGPGDPADIPAVLDLVKKVAGKCPTLGICLGHQLLGLAFGGTTHKLKFGHHGGNHAVKDLQTGRCTITSQNHNYVLARDVPDCLEITHININDGTVEGFRHKHLPIIGIQYHPEAAPGPEDNAYILHHFIKPLEQEEFICQKGMT